ncbi:MAG: hypothetical protein KKI08_21285, partial [Armatimonadetes bacterium]|nr:hypothetical protein [Armatimonadota bacterium]
SLDPLGIEGGTNLFAFPKNTFGYFDPLGLDWNYRLVDSGGGTYYHGRAGDNETPADVMARHGRTNGNDAAGNATQRFVRGSDQLERVTPVGTPRNAVRGIEEDGISNSTGTNVGRRSCNGNNVRGNNIRGVGLNNSNRGTYTTAGSNYLAGQGVTNTSQLPALSVHR